MKFARRKKHQVLIQADTTDSVSCSASRSSRRDCLEDMFHKLKECNVVSGSEPGLSSVDQVRHKLLTSLTLAEDSAQSDEGLMKVKRLRSKLISNFVKIDELSATSDTSFVSWNSHNAMCSFDKEVGCEVFDHSTSHHSISVIRVYEIPQDSAKYDSLDEAFEVKVNNRFESSMDEYMDAPEPGFEVSTNDKLTIDYVRVAKEAREDSSSTITCDDSSKRAGCGISSYGDSNISVYSEDCFDRCEYDCGSMETATDASFVGMEITI
ncbi:hypothetical protein ACHAWO_004245 [Cyclotella atomus]|jgi:hypothetical protein|uniref:Uncharacterized protein n=1 Tax=Cyclotella atomus TaxID=382360 RepID=A0ABD3NLP7_9STRA